MKAISKVAYAVVCTVAAIMIISGVVAMTTTVYMMATGTHDANASCNVYNDCN